MDGLLINRNDYTFVYIDDVAVFSNSWDEHIYHLITVFDVLLNAGLTIQAAKAQLATTSFIFLGHRVGGGYISPHEAKISNVREFIQPRSKEDVWAFIGLINYYRRFIPHISTLSASLTDLLQLHKPYPVDRTEDCASAFAASKQALCSAPVLSPPDYYHQFIQQTDASGLGISAVLTQDADNGEEHPIAFYSRKMQPRKSRYSATEQEGLAVVNACMHFMAYLLGYPFTVVTDHKALSFLELKDPHSHRLTRWIDILRQFTFSIEYRPSKENSNADPLSCQAWQTPSEEQQMGKNFSKEGMVLGSAQHCSKP